MTDKDGHLFPYEKENALAERFGWTPVKDGLRSTCSHCHYCKFNKGDEWIWLTGWRLWWTRATKVVGPDDKCERFVDHVEYPTLSDAFLQSPNGERNNRYATKRE